MQNDCLRPASLGDIPHAAYYQAQTIPGKAMWGPAEAERVENAALRALYDAEWKKRGFACSP